jgi:hypothetical protein
MTDQCPLTITEPPVPITIGPMVAPLVLAGIVIAVVIVLALVLTIALGPILGPPNVALEEKSALVIDPSLIPPEFT